MELSYHYLMLLNDMAFKKKLFEKLAGTGLSVGQPKALDYLLSHDGCMQKELADGLLVEAATCATLLKKMEKDKLILRQGERRDKRIFHIYLTEKGRAFAVTVREVMYELESETLDCLDTGEKEQLIGYLKMIRKRLMR